MRGLWQAPLLLLLYQTAPVEVHREGGRVRLGIGFGRGKYDEVIPDRHGVDCAGNSWFLPGKQAPVTRRTAGGTVELWFSKVWRLTASLGTYRTASPADWVSTRNGHFGTIGLATETRPVGLGFGVRALPAQGAENRETRMDPLVYFRGGNADRIHFRLDAGQSAPGVLPGYRIGLASGYGPKVQARFFAGLLAFPDGPLRWTTELEIPIGPVAPVVFGSFGRGWDTGAGVRVMIP
jgi:hypothetical protein